VGVLTMIQWHSNGGQVEANGGPVKTKGGLVVV
jgi:hypothetical protein